MTRYKATAVLLISVCSLAGQDKEGAVVSPQIVQENYESMRYRDVIEMVQRELEDNPSQNRSDLEVYLKFLSMALYSEEGEAATRSALTSLLLVNPGFEFSANEVSPKIVALLEDIKNSEYEVFISSKVLEKYIIVEDTQSSELLSAILFPGWGHIKRGQKRGYLYSALFGLSASSSLYYSYRTRINHLKYSEAYLQPVINETYAEYNLSYKTRNSLILSAIIVYCLSIGDLLITSR